MGETVKPSLKTGSTSLNHLDLASFTRFETRLKPWHGVPGSNQVPPTLEPTKALLVCVLVGGVSKFQSFRVPVPAVRPAKEAASTNPGNASPGAPVPKRRKRIVAA
jgi:hypothetical protein